MLSRIPPGHRDNMKTGVQLWPFGEDLPSAVGFAYQYWAEAGAAGAVHLSRLVSPRLEVQVQHQLREVIVFCFMRRRAIGGRAALL